jgi:hypothetical protein
MKRRMVNTSRGLIAVDLDPDPRLGPSRLGFSVTVVTFDRDGWEVKGKSWLRETADSPLGEFLASFVGLPHEEAEALSAQIQGTWIEEWRARGGEEEDRELRRFTNRFLAVVAVVLAFAIVGIVFAIWVLAT